MSVLTECWPWNGSRDAFGYGKKKIARKQYYTHRLAYWWANGMHIPAGALVLHRCDNPPCCNPAHLYAGTAKDNVRDTVVRGRHHHVKKTACAKGHEYTSETTRFVGERRTRRCLVCDRETAARRNAAKPRRPVKLGTERKNSRLNGEAVRRIRSLREQGLSYHAIAKRFSVSPGSIRQVITGKSWRHIQ